MNAKKQARRAAAITRFRILSLNDWLDMICDPHRVSNRNFRARSDRPVSMEVQHTAYVQRKQVEAASLGITL